MEHFKDFHKYTGMKTATTRSVSLHGLSIKTHTLGKRSFWTLYLHPQQENTWVEQKSMGIKDYHNVIQCEVKQEKPCIWLCRTFGPFFSHVLTRAKGQRNSHDKKKQTKNTLCSLYGLCPSISEYLYSTEGDKVDSRFTRMLRHL